MSSEITHRYSPSENVIFTKDSPQVPKYIGSYIQQHRRGIFTKYTPLTAYFVQILSRPRSRHTTHRIPPVKVISAKKKKHRLAHKPPYNFYTELSLDLSFRVGITKEFDDQRERARSDIAIEKPRTISQTYRKIMYVSDRSLIIREPYLEHPVYRLPGFHFHKHTYIHIYIHIVFECDTIAPIKEQIGMRIRLSSQVCRPMTPYQ